MLFTKPVQTVLLGFYSKDCNTESSNMDKGTGYRLSYNCTFFNASHRHLIDNVPYVDPSRVAVWGWSYGGTVASRMLALDVDNSLKCAIAVAPVTKWELYGKWSSAIVLSTNVTYT